MTLGSELEVSQPEIDNKIKADDNDSGHSSVNTPDSDPSGERILTVTVQPTVGEPFDLNVHDSELVQELFQTLLDREQTCHRTCFSLAINGNQIDNYSEVRNVPGFSEGCTISVVDEPYTVREARLHLRQLREILKVGLNQDSHEPACNTEGSPTFLPTINLQPEMSEKRGEWKQNEVLPADHILPGCKERSFAHILVPSQKPIIAVKSVSVSPFNPPPGPRKLKGDVLYIDATTAENRTFHVTCCTKGFYVNNSQDGKFDPTQSNAHKTIFHSLVELLQTISPIFKKNYPMLLKRRNEKTMVEKIPTSYPTASWIAPVNRTDTYSEDPIRAEELTEPFRVGFEDNMPGLLRDWNEELQTTYEMPKTTLNERAVRDRSYYKIHADFVNAAAKGAQAIIDGNIVAINPGDERKTHMYIWNNIFFSLGFDVKDHYKELGGDAAAFAATAADLQGVRAIASLEDPKLNVLGMAIFDYRGYRVTAQSIIPGILEREQDQSVIYGSIDFGKTIVSDECYHELLADVGKQLKILPHSVLTTKDGVEKELKLFTSYETKGIIGNDGRKYVLDLLRTMPPDVHFLEDAEVSEASKNYGFPRPFPHKLAALRRELIDAFCESKFVDFIKSSAGYIRAEVVDATESKNDEKIKSLAEAENALSQAFVDISEDKPVTVENEILKRALFKAYADVHSLHDDQYEIKFNPDCFSPLIKHAPSENLERQRRLVVEAAEFVITHQIPEFVRSLIDCAFMPIDGETLSENMHQKGINIRYLGDVARRLDTTSSFARPLVLSELLARSAKHVLRKINVQTSSEQLATSLAHILNCLFGSVGGDVAQNSSSINKKNNKKNGKKRSGGAWSSLTTQSLWSSITEESAYYYGYNIEVESLESFTELHDIQKTALLRRLCRILGLQIAAKDYSLDNSNGKKAVFTEDDIINVYPVIKHQQPFTADAKKMMIRGQHAMSMGVPRDAFDCIGESISLMTAVYGLMHQDMAQPLRSLARLSHVMGESAEALHQQHRATIMSERLIGLDSGSTIVEYISLAHYAFTSLLFPGSLKPLYRARYLLNIVFGERHPLMAQIDANIGTILFTMQEYDTALKFLQSADKISKSIGEPKKLKSGLITNLIARTLAMRGDFRPALVAEKETCATFKELYGENHFRTQESSEYLRTLTQQAVTFQKKMMDANNKTTISELIHVQTPSVKSIFEVLNIINGILIISPQNLQALSADSTANQINQNGTETDINNSLASQLETETLD